MLFPCCQCEAGDRPNMLLCPFFALSWLQPKPTVEFPSLALTFSPISGGIDRAAPSSEANQSWFVDENVDTLGSSDPPPAWRLGFLSGHSLDSRQCLGSPIFNQKASDDIAIRWRFVHQALTHSYIFLLCGGIPYGFANKQAKPQV